MIGLSPRISTLTEHQRSTSAAVAQAVPDLPTSVTDLISELAAPDYSLALQPVAVNDDGRIVLNPENFAVIAMIELALNAPSSECDPAIKARIFSNACEKYQQHNGMSRYLCRILNAMKDKGLQVILDDVVLTGFEMGQEASIDLSGMSAQRAIFDGMELENLKMEGADFTGAKFISTKLERVDISKADITGATFSKVQFLKTEVSALRCNQSGILKNTTTGKTMTLDDIDVAPDIAILNAENLTTGPDMEDFTFPAKNVFGLGSDSEGEPASFSDSFGFSIT